MSADAKPKGLTPEALRTLIKDVCGEVVASRLEELNKRVTDHGNTWITAMEESQKRIDAAREAKSQKGLVFGGIVGCLAAAKGDVGHALKIAKEAKQHEGVIKALEASQGTTGGFLVAPEHSSDFIDLLTPRAVVRSFGTPVLPLDSGVLDMPKLNTAASASYIGEGRDITKSEQTFGQVRWSSKQLAALVPISNTLLRRASPQVNAIVRNDVLRVMALKEDLTFLRSQGGEHSPRGLRYLALGANVLTANVTVNLANVTNDLGRLVLALEEANVAFTNPGWIFAPRTKMYLMTVRDGNSNYVFRDEMLTGRLWGYPYKTTTQVPRNLGAGSNESEVYLVDFDDVAIAQELGLEVAMSQDASYKDENGNLVSAFSLNQTVMRVIQMHDFNTRYPESIAVLTGVTWAP